AALPTELRQHHFRNFLGGGILWELGRGSNSFARHFDFSVGYFRFESTSPVKASNVSLILLTQSKPVLAYQARHIKNTPVIAQPLQPLDLRFSVIIPTENPN